MNTPIYHTFVPMKNEYSKLKTLRFIRIKPFPPGVAVTKRDMFVTKRDIALYLGNNIR